MWVIFGGWDIILNGLRWVGVYGALFWVGGGGWENIFGGWGWVGLRGGRGVSALFDNVYLS